jgi:transposase
MTHKAVFIGLDTHKETIAVAIAEEGRDSEVRYYGQIANEPAAVMKLVKKLAGNYGKLFFCYEAGPCGYGLQRQIAGVGHHCVVIAPSHTPTKKGVRVKKRPPRRPGAGPAASCWRPDHNLGAR